MNDDNTITMKCVFCFAVCLFFVSFILLLIIIIIFFFFYFFFFLLAVVFIALFLPSIYENFSITSSATLYNALIGYLFTSNLWMKKELMG